MSNYPEHDKLTAVSEKSQAVGEFLEWLQNQHVRLMVWKEDVEERCPRIFCDDGQVFGKECKTCHGSGYSRTGKAWVDFSPLGITERLAIYFNVDLNKIEQEKRAMLDAIRAQHAAQA